MGTFFPRPSLQSLHQLFQQSTIFSSLSDFGVFCFRKQRLFEVFVLLMEQRKRDRDRAGKQTSMLMWSQGQFSRSQPFIPCFALAWRSKCTATTVIQVSLQLWPKHCTSVGGPIKVLRSSRWELQPPVKDSSLLRHILESGLALPSVDSLTALTRLHRRPLQESVSVHLSVKRRHGKVKKTTPTNCWSTAQEPQGTHGCISEHRSEASAASLLPDSNRHCGNEVVIWRQAGKQVQRPATSEVSTFHRIARKFLDLLKQGCGDSV